MATITFAAGTVIPSTWLNDVNALVYGAASPPANAIRVTTTGNVGFGVNPSTALITTKTVTTTPVFNLDAGSTYITSAFLFRTDQKVYSLLAGPGAGPGIQARWDSSTANRYLAFGAYDNLATWSEFVRIDAAGQVGIGVAPSGAALHVKSALVNIVKAETTTARGGGAVVYALLDPTGTKGYYGYGAANDVMHVYQGLNAATNFYTNATHHVTLSATGDFTLRTAGAKLGYDTGAGGTVTQATSKATGVTLNTSVGRIVMNNASLAASTSVTFALTNSTIAATDLVVLNLQNGSGSSNSYVIQAQPDSGACAIHVRNITGGALAEALIINFAVIKGVIA